MSVPKITLPTGTDIELPIGLWKPVNCVAVLDKPDGLTLVPVLVTADAPDAPTVWSALVLDEASSRSLVRQLDAIRQQNPAWLK